MKYGRMKWKYSSWHNTNNSISANIGDNIQTLAVDYLYKKMGIEKKDIVDINNEVELQEYDGEEYVVMPMAGYFSLFKSFKQLPTSKKIIPVFFSFEMSNEEECDDIIPYLKMYEPIGCRDEATSNLLKSKGVESFVSGCLSITLPKRDLQQSCNADKVFLVDVPKSLENYIPDELKHNAVEMHHCFNIGQNYMTDKDVKKIDEYANSVLERYRNEAKLVVTSRLHALIPCIAMGIPVIFANENFDDRFSWIDKLIPLYNYKTFDTINWNVQTVECENIKNTIYNVFVDRIKKASEKAKILELNNFWCDRKCQKYNEILYDRIEELKSVYNTNDHFLYGIWGAGWHGRLAYRIMKKEFPNAKFEILVDKFAESGFCDINITKPDDLNRTDINHWLITTNPGKNEAIEKIKCIGGKYTLFISQAYLII